MSKIITAWVETYTAKERKELIDYLCSKEKFVCLDYPIDGYQIIHVSCEPGFYMTVPSTEKDQSSIGNEKVFSSAQSYIDYCEIGIDKNA